MFRLLVHLEFIFLLCEIGIYIILYKDHELSLHNYDYQHLFPSGLIWHFSYRQNSHIFRGLFLGSLLSIYSITSTVLFLIIVTSYFDWISTRFVPLNSFSKLFSLFLHSSSRLIL